MTDRSPMQNRQGDVAPDVLDVGPFDPDELVRWAENYGHPEGWAKKAQSLHGKNEDLREALMSIWIYLRLEPGKDHAEFGTACGVDACILCLAESVAKKAMRS
jgi:hypothetical protein